MPNLERLSLAEMERFLKRGLKARRRAHFSTEERARGCFERTPQPARPRR
jgi:hypothetical protein